MNLTADIDKKDIKDISSVQGELLKETVSYLSKHSPFYREQLKGLGGVRAIDDISRFPFTSKEDLQKNNWEVLCLKRDKLADIVATTGTTGTPIFIGLTRHDMERLAENEKRCFSFAGVTPEDLFILSVTMDNLFIAGMAYYSGLQRLGAGVVRVGPQSPQRQIELIRALKPTGIVAVPSFIAALSKYIKSEGINFSDSSLKKGVLIGDTIRNPDFSSNALGKIVEDIGEIEFYSTYGITEAAIAFCECGFHKGFHSHPDLVYPEIVDDAGNAVKDGETGELVVTTFQVEGMPLLRYKTGDMTFRIPERCECGRGSYRIGPIIGRKAQRLKVKGTTLYPKTIENALLEISGVENYVIEAYTGDDHADHIIVRVGSNNGKSSLKETLCDAIRAKARVTPRIEIMHPHEVEKILFEGGRRKARTFVDRRTKHA